MNIKKILKYLYYKPLSYNIECLPYRKYTFEIKLKSIENIIEYETNYILSLSFKSFLEDLYREKNIKINNKQYPIREIEWTKLLKTELYYAYVWDSCTDHFRCLSCNDLDSLIKRQKKYIKYAKYLKPKRLKSIITEAKHYYI